MPSIRELAHLPTLTPDLLLSSTPLPPVSGPVRFTLDGSAANDRPALLRESVARLGFEYEINALSGEALEVDVGVLALPNLMLSAGYMRGSHNRRTRAQVENSADDVALMVNIKGPQRIIQGDDDVVLGDGEAVFLSGSDPCSFTHHPPGDLMALRFPRAQFAPLVADIRDRYMRRIPGNAPALRLLTNYLGMVWDGQATATAELQHVVTTHVYDLMAVMAGATRDARHEAQGRGVHAARLGLVKQDIACRLGQPDLSVGALARRHRCTPRFIQRMFEAEGTTFTAYVLTQRLARAHRLLSDPRQGAAKISSVAFDCGFGDVSYFNRAFRRHYGAAPSDVRPH